SHELKTPLATIKIMVQTLLYQEVYDEGMSKDFLTDVDKEVDRLAAVVSDLLTLVGMDSGESKLNMEELSVTDMVSEDVKRLSPLARERGVELEYNASQSLEVYGDRIKLDQVFYNLIDNAIKYTPRGEGVKVEVTRQNKNAVIKVKDNGIGIPEADIKHIFDRFYRVDKARSRETGGTGLGLSIAKQIILAHNGNISVSSKPDMGSTFTVTLPLGGKSSARQVSQ
ncbi:MAG: ATP-binding protein, partial [Clostridia bacterium]|nr:ATP-binding protein [Clostridia bacterium]